MPALIRPFRGVHPDIAKDVFVADTATVIGDVKIGARSSVWYGVTIRGDIEEIRIGAGTNIQDGTVIHVTARELQWPKNGAGRWSFAGPGPYSRPSPEDRYWG